MGCCAQGSGCRSLWLRQCEPERARVRCAPQVLRLSGEQKEALLDLRKLHLRNLRALYEDRQRLNLQVAPG